jgi:trigger factor
MQVSVESTGKLERRMEVQVPAARVEKEITQRLRDVGRTARLKGFRPGKAPINILRQQFGPQVRQEVLSELMRQSFAEAITEQKLNPAGGPRIEPTSTAQGQDLKYTAIFEVFPEVSLQGLEGMAIERPVASVSDEDIEAMIESLRKQNPRWKEVTRAAAAGDRVTVDFAGTIEGEPFEGGKGENVSIQLGAGQMLPDFEAGLVGTTQGERKSIDVSFPVDYHNKALAAKAAVFDVSLKKVEEPETAPLDEEFATAFGIQEGGVESLRQAVGDNMRRELDDKIQARIKSQILDKLLAANPIEVPMGLVESQVREMQIDVGRRMGAREVSQLPPREQFVEPARRRVALGLLINEIIKQQKIELDRSKVTARLQDMVSTYEDPQEAMRLYQQNRQAMHQVETLVLEDQVVDWLRERSRVEDQPTTFKELMNFGGG